MEFEITEHQRLQTYGARACVPFSIDDEIYLGIPQLAEDISSEEPDMNGGNSNTATIIYKWNQDKFEEFQRLDTHGGECVDFHNIGDRKFLAIANIRSGADGKFDLAVDSKVYEWLDGKFKHHQSIPTFAAKYCHFFESNNKTYLAFAEGVHIPNIPTHNSKIYKWENNSFVEEAEINSLWGYCCNKFDIDNQSFLAFADNSTKSSIYSWNNGQISELQSFTESGGGRHFEFFQIDSDYYLAYANLFQESFLFKWDGTKFIEHQQFSGAAGRNFHFYDDGENKYLFRVNFISGSKDSPTTKLKSQVYKWDGSNFAQIYEFETLGGTESSIFKANSQTYLAVSNSLDENVRFRTDSIIYRIK